MNIGELKKIIENMEDETPIVAYDSNNDLVEVDSINIIGVAVSVSGGSKTYTESANAEQALVINIESQKT